MLRVKAENKYEKVAEKKQPLSSVIGVEKHFMISDITDKLLGVCY